MKKEAGRKDVTLRAAAHLLMGRRLEVHGKAGLIIYMGCSTSNRLDPFWYEHPGGRTYKATAVEVVSAVLPHVGSAAIENAKVWPV